MTVVIPLVLSTLFPTLKYCHDSNYSRGCFSSSVNLDETYNISLNRNVFREYLFPQNSDLYFFSEGLVHFSDHAFRNSIVTYFHLGTCTFSEVTCTFFSRGTENGTERLKI